MRILSALCGVVLLAGLYGCSSSTKFSGSSANSPTSTAPATGVVAHVATYRTRGSAASDHIFDACQQAALAPLAPGVKAYDLPACSTTAVSLGIRTATAAVASLSREVAAFRSVAVPTATRLATVTKLNELTAALSTWGHCADTLTTPRYFQASHCAAELKREGAARAALMTVALQWPKSS